jgi:hypothetical protein
VYKMHFSLKKLHKIIMRQLHGRLRSKYGTHKAYCRLCSYPCETPIKIALSVRLYACRSNNYKRPERIFTKFYNWKFHYLSRFSNFDQNRIRITGTSHEDLHAFLSPKCLGGKYPKPQKRGIPTQGISRLFAKAIGQIQNLR